MTVADGFVFSPACGCSLKDEVVVPSMMVKEGLEVVAPVASPTAPTSCEKFDFTFVPERAKASFDGGCWSRATAEGPVPMEKAPEEVIAETHIRPMRAVMPTELPSAMRWRTCSGFCFSLWMKSCISMVSLL